MTTSERLLPRDTRAALQSLPVKDCSRSLYFDRFSRPDLDKDDRKQFFTTGFDAHRSSVRAENWAAAMRLDPAQRLFAQLQSRLMVNMAGGVMENAGLCLDRFGLPYIPGSAVKGCARRAAVAALHEWCETGVKPTGDDNLFTGVCASFNSPAEMLAAIARVFGWSEQEWKTREDFSTDDDWIKKRSDFAWACDISAATASQSPAPTGRSIPAQGNALGNASKTTPSPVGAAQSSANGWHSIRADALKLLGNAATFAGSISFLPAHPIDMPSNATGLPLPPPPLGKLELDIVTCHHGKYYSGEMPVATDTEEPVPVIFPAVAVGHVFGFALRPLRNCPNDLLTHARTWLATGLATFGLGAKTAAGYGWFDTSESTHKSIADSLEKARHEREVAEANAKQEASAKAKQDEAARRKKDLAGKLAQLPPEQQEDAKVEALTADQFRSALDNYANRAVEEQKAVVRAMRLDPGAPGSRRASWDDLKAKAQKKGGKFAQTEQAIRQYSKQMFPGKEGKMP